MNVIPPLPIVGTGSITRAGPGTYTDKAGVLQTAANDILRLSYNPANLSAAPVALIEAAATNLLLWSGDPTNAAWAKGANVTSVGATDGPYGMSARRYSAAGAGNCSITQITAVTPLTMYSGIQVIRLPSGVVSGSTFVFFYDTGGGFLGFVNFASLSAISGWQENKISFTTPANCTQIKVHFGVVDPSIGYVFDLAYAQFVLGSAVTSYIPTTSAAVTRAADIITGSGLVYSSAIEAAPAAYVPGTTYGAGVSVSVAGAGNSYDCYTSQKVANLGNTPATSPLWWLFAGTTYGAYSSGTTYILGDQVIDTTTHNVYSSVPPGNNLGGALADETKWFLQGKTNKWAQFDVLRNTATVGASPMVTVLAPGVRIDAIALLGLVATSVNITMTVNGVAVYSYAQNLNQREAVNAYEHCFKEFSTQQALALFRLPPYSTAVTTITLVNSTGLVECGGCFVGSAVYIGDIQYEAESDALNFSTITRDPQGVATLIPEGNVPKVIGQIFLSKSVVNTAYALRRKLGGSAAVWVGIDDGTDGYFDALLIQGIYRRFTINLKHPEHAVISLEVEEL
jgi:hypothetical protein